MKLPNYDDEYLLFGLFFMIGNKLQVLGDNFFEEITIKQWYIIAMIEIFEKNYPTLGELSEVAGSSHQNVKAIVQKLEEKGYVKTIQDKVDRRKTRIMKTDKCNKIAEKYDEKQIHFMKSLFQGINPEDLRSAVKVCAQLEDNIENMK